MEELRVEHIDKSFDNRQILRDVNLSLLQGEIVSLLGVSGGGKTTLFNIIAGLTAPDKGDVLLDDKSIVGKPGRISYMLQKDLLLPHKTVLDNVALPLIIRGEKKRSAREKAFRHFEAFGLKGYEKKHPKELSGGMRQRAALLRTYLFSGEVALLAEPFSALDTITRSAMHEWYLSVMEEIKLPTILITHDVDEAILLSDRIYILSRESEDKNEPTSIHHIIEINNRDKKSKDYLLTEDFLEYKRQIVSVI